jgi:trehalose 6-phosphate phosphatase
VNTSQNLPTFPDSHEGSWALFLDVDGTLLELAEHPDMVVVPEGLVPMLERLKKSLDGALALVSGRSLASLESVLGKTSLDAAGCHGAELRIDGAVELLVAADTLVPRIAKRLARHADAIPLAMVEVKTHSIALHYRPPALDARQARQLAELALAGDDRKFRLLEGKQVVEILPIGAGKGRAIAYFLDRPPYAGRIPVFIGDDVTDEEGFREVNRRDGLSIHIGADGETAARYRAPDVAAATAWLAQLVGAAAKSEIRQAKR